MDDSSLGPRCWWCGAALAGTRQRYCSRPRLCRDKAYRARRRARALGPERGALARAGHRLDSYLTNVREVLLQAVLQEETWPGMFATAAAHIDRYATDLVRVCVIQERAAGTSWATIGEAFGISADAARKRWAYYELAHREEPEPEPPQR
ncbi:hypothetical protein AB0D56_38370 [Streptomyces sp. NPDC048209]|uniref:hypothetical protein n=1 Tax=Streptomyces sp. NPDC048209 TaxID=3156689 RepID=UPI0034498183